MHLPINIIDLLQSGIVESDRLEFKTDWNPESVLRTICAFANDFNNFGGGYIVIGVEEKNGKPVLPPKGIPVSKVDKIQKELIRICAFLKPVYTPIIAAEKLKGKYLLVIWVPGGQARPYSAPATLGKNKEYKYFIRKASTTVMAKHEELKELLSLTATVPFDDRMNHHATFEALRLPLIQAFLNEVDSQLLEETRIKPLVDICRQMAIVDGGNEYLRPRNVGLLFFSDEPEKYFSYAQIDVVHFPDDEGGDIIQEKIFKGPLDHQLRSALRYIRDTFITERIVKIPGQAEARRFFNYPYEAVEEALVNAVYHRGYEIREPIEVRINRQCIRVLSFPGADPSIPQKEVEAGRLFTRRYRNRRIGEFLKELDFTEGRGTGIPKIKRILAVNGSPEPLFVTDEGRTSFYTEIKIHPEFLADEIPPEESKGVYDGVHHGVYDGVHDHGHLDLSQTELKILSLVQEAPVGLAGILEVFGYKVVTRNIRTALSKLLTLQLVAYTIPDKPRSKKQQYKITWLGKTTLTMKDKGRSVNFCAQ